MRKFCWKLGMFIGLALSYVLIVVTSPLWALLLCWREHDKLNTDNVVFANFRR